MTDEKSKEKDSCVGSSQDLLGASVDIDILSELGSIGAGHAATSLSEILQQQVTIGVPRIHNVPAHLLPKIFGLHEMPTTAMYVRLTGDSECDILLMLEADEARNIAAMMTMAPSVDELDPNLEVSAVEELANILVGSFLNAISDFLEVRLMQAPPERIADAFDAILDAVLTKNAMVYEESLMFDISFRTSGKTSKCLLLLFPSPALRCMLVQKSKVMMGIDPPEHTPNTNSNGH